MTFQLDLVTEFELDSKVPLNGDLIVSVDGEDILTNGIEMSGYGIKFKSPVNLDIGKTVSCSYVPHKTGDISLPVDYSIYKIETISLKEHIISAVYHLK